MGLHLSGNFPCWSGLSLGWVWIGLEITGLVWTESGVGLDWSGNYWVGLDWVWAGLEITGVAWSGAGLGFGLPCHSWACQDIVRDLSGLVWAFPASHRLILV